MTQPTMLTDTLTPEITTDELTNLDYAFELVALSSLGQTDELVVVPKTWLNKTHERIRTLGANSLQEVFDNPSYHDMWNDILSELCRFPHLKNFTSVYRY